MKLTKAQIELLAEVCDSSLCHCVPEYRPAQVLVARGLAIWDADGRLFLYPTPAGRAALQERTNG